MQVNSKRSWVQGIQAYARTRRRRDSRRFSASPRLCVRPGFSSDQRSDEGRVIPKILRRIYLDPLDQRLCALQGSEAADEVRLGLHLLSEKIEEGVHGGFSVDL